MDVISGAVAGLRAQLDAARRENESLAGARDALRRRVAGLEADVRGAAQSAGMLDAQLAEARAAIVVKSDDCATLQAEVDRLAGLVAAMQASRDPDAAADACRAVMEALHESHAVQAAVVSELDGGRARERDLLAAVAGLQRQVAEEQRAGRAAAAAALALALASVARRRTARLKSRTLHALHAHALRADAQQAAQAGARAVATVQSRAADCLALLRVRYGGRAALRGWRQAATEGQARQHAAEQLAARHEEAAARAALQTLSRVAHQRQRLRSAVAALHAAWLRSSFSAWRSAAAAGTVQLWADQEAARAAQHRQDVQASALRWWQAAARRQRLLAATALRGSLLPARTALRTWHAVLRRTRTLRQLLSTLTRCAARATFHAWRGVAETHRRDTAARSVAAALQRVARGDAALALQRWRSTAARRAAARRALRRLLLAAGRTGVAQAWGTWRDAAVQARGAHGMQAALASSFQDRLARGRAAQMFTWWLQRMRHRQVLRTCVAQFQLRSPLVHAAAAVRTWRAFVRRRTHQAAIVRSYQHRLLGGVVSAWRAHIAATRRQDSAAMDRVAAVRRSRDGMERWVRATWSAWVTASRARTHARRLVAALMARSHRLALAAGFATWQRAVFHRTSHVAAARAAAQGEAVQATLVSAVWRRQVAGRILSAWHRWAAHRRAAAGALVHAVAAAAARQLKEVLVHWRGAAAAEARTTTAQRHGAAASIAAWRWWVQRRALARSAAARAAALAGALASRAAAGRAFSLWRAGARHAAAMRRCLHRMGQASTRSALRTTFQRWRRAAATASSSAAVTALQQTAARDATATVEHMHAHLARHLVGVMARRRAQAAFTGWAVAAAAHRAQRLRARLVVARWVSLHALSSSKLASSAVALRRAFQRWRLTTNGEACLAHQAALAAAQSHVHSAIIAAHATVVQHLVRAQSLPQLFSAVHALFADHLPQWNACLWMLDPARREVWALVADDAAAGAPAPAAPAATVTLMRGRSATAGADAPARSREPASGHHTAAMRLARPTPLGTTQRPAPPAGLDAASVASGETTDTAAAARAGATRVTAGFNSSLVGLAAAHALAGNTGGSGGESPSTSVHAWTEAGWLVCGDAARHPAYHADVDLGVQFALQRAAGAGMELSASGAIPCVVLPCYTRATAKALAEALDVRAVEADLRHAGAADAGAIAVSLYQPCAVLQVAAAASPSPPGGAASWSHTFTPPEQALLSFVALAVGVAVDHLASHALAKRRVKQAHAMLRAAHEEIGAAKRGMDHQAARTAVLTAERDAAVRAGQRAADGVAALESKVATLLGAEATAQAAHATADALRATLAARDGELEEARQAAAVLQLALEEVAHGHARGIDAAATAARVREAEASVLRGALEAARADSAAVLAAATGALDGVRR